MTLNFPQPGLASSPGSASHGPSEPSGGGLPGKSSSRLRIFQDCRSYPRLRASLALFAMPGRRGCPSLAVLICSFSRSLVASPSPTHNISRPSGAMGKPTLRMPVSTHGGRDCNLRELHHLQAPLPARCSPSPPSSSEQSPSSTCSPSPTPPLFLLPRFNYPTSPSGTHSSSQAASQSTSKALPVQVHQHE